MEEAAPFVGALALTIVVACQGDDDRMKRTSVLLLANWLACMAARQVSISVMGSTSPWAAWLVIDAATLWLVIRPPAGKVQAVIAGLLFGQVLWHAAFGYVANPAAGNLYKTALNAGGWVQVGILFGGAGYDQGRRMVAACGRRLFRHPRAADDLARLDIEP